MLCEFFCFNPFLALSVPPPPHMHQLQCWLGEGCRIFARSLLQQGSSEASTAMAAGCMADAREIKDCIATEEREGRGNDATVLQSHFQVRGGERNI